MYKILVCKKKREKKIKYIILLQSRLPLRRGFMILKKIYIGIADLDISDLKESYPAWNQIKGKLF